MDHEGENKLKELQADFEQVSGQPFSNFYCPIVFRDEIVKLCKAHVVMPPNELVVVELIDYYHF